MLQILNRSVLPAYVSVYSIELLLFKAQEHSKSLVRLFELYGLPYDCEFRHALYAYEFSTNNQGLREFALKRCQVLAVSQEEQEAIAYSTSEENLKINQAKDPSLVEIEKYVYYILPGTSSNERKQIITIVNKLMVTFFQRFENNFVFLAQTFALLPVECRLNYLKQRLYELALEKFKAEKLDELNLILRGDCFEFIRRKLKMKL